MSAIYYIQSFLWYRNNTHTHLWNGRCWRGALCGEVAVFVFVFAFVFVFVFVYTRIHKSPPLEMALVGEEPPVGRWLATGIWKQPCWQVITTWTTLAPSHTFDNSHLALIEFLLVSDNHALHQRRYDYGQLIAKGKCMLAGIQLSIDQKQSTTKWRRVSSIWEHKRVKCIAPGWLCCVVTAHFVPLFTSSILWIWIST